MGDKFLEAVILDLGGVVFGISVERILRSWAESSGCKTDHIYEKFKVDRFYELFETGSISAEQYRSHVCNLLGISLTAAQFDMGWNNIYLDLLPGIEELLRQLRTKVRLTALTNTNEIHALDWRRRYSTILSYFEKVFASHEIKARKPEAESYRVVIDYLRLAPNKIAFFDDNPENVQGAIAVGLNAFVVSSPAEVAEKLRDFGIEISLDK